MYGAAGSKEHEEFIKSERKKAKMQLLGVILLSCFLYFTHIPRLTYPQFYVATMLFVLILLSVLRAAFTSPGIVDDERMRQMVEEYSLSEPGGGGSQQRNSDLPKAIPDRVERCPHTGKPRPARAHFATLLNANVLKLDHFCFFVNNVIGHRNYKYFWQVLGYLNVGCIYAVWLQFWMDRKTNPTPSSLLSVVQIIISVGGFGFTGSLMYHHLWLLRKNMTSIEYLRNNAYWCRAEHLKVKVPMTHAYDRSLFQNIKEAFGEDFFWLLPTTPTLPSDGYTWEISPNRVKEIQNGLDQVQEKLSAMFQQAGFKLGV